MAEEVIVQPPRVHFSSPVPSYLTENGVTVKSWTPSQDFEERAVDAHQLESPPGDGDDIGFSPILSPPSQSWMDGIFGCMRPVFGNFIGKSRADDWEIPFESIKNLEWLGSGAQGAVFSGRLRGQVIAVKKVKEKQETEIRHLKQLHHENIIRFLGVCTQAPCYGIVMEYCSKGTLHDHLKNNNNITPVQTLDWAVQIAAGMSFLHSRNIVHRDLKSPNVLLSDDSKLKISDFGTSRVWSEASAEMSFIGTYAWMAPEIIRKEPCSEKVDVWSYGVVLWELVTGETPYRGLETARILFGVGNNTLSLPLPETLPPGLQLLMKMCWESRPRNRPSFVSIMAHLSIAAPELINRDPAQFSEEKNSWRKEIEDKLNGMGYRDRCEQNASKALLKKRKAEMKHANEIRIHYEIRMAQVNQVVQELGKIKQQLEERERDLNRRERLQGVAHVSGSPSTRSISRLSKKNNWRFGLKRRSAQDSSMGLPLDPVSRSSTLPARLEKPHIPMSSQRSTRRVPVYVEVEDSSRSLFDLIRRPFQSNSTVPTISEMTQHSITQRRVDVTDMRCSFSDTDSDRSSTDADDENANDIERPKMDKNGNSRDSLDDLNKTVQELGKWERVRGRASGSSKNGSGRYKDNYIAATRYSGRYCTIDVSQYSKSVKHEYFQQDVMSRSLTNDVQVPGDKKDDEPRNGGSQEGFSSSNWETCSEEDITAKQAVNDAALRRESFARHPVQRLKRPSSIISSQSLPEKPSITDDIGVQQLIGVTVTECEL